MNSFLELILMMQQLHRQDSLKTFIFFLMIHYHVTNFPKKSQENINITYKPLLFDISVVLNVKTTCGFVLDCSLSIGLISFKIMIQKCKVEINL